MTTPKAMSLDELKSEIDGIIVLLTSDGQYHTETGYVDYRIVEKAKSRILNLMAQWADEQRVNELRSLVVNYMADMDEVFPAEVKDYIQDRIKTLTGGEDSKDE